MPGTPETNLPRTEVNWPSVMYRPGVNWLELNWSRTEINWLQANWSVGETRPGPP